MPSLVRVTGALVGYARAGCARTSSLPSAVLAVAARLSRAMLSLVRVTGALVGCARAGCACFRVAAISCPCCGGSPSKSNAVTSACDWRLGRLCSRWLRSHVVAAISCPCCGGSHSKGNAVTSACDWRLGRLCSRWLRLHVVAAISCPCCGGSPFKSNAVTRACDWRLGRLCSRWLRLHLCRRHQLSLPRRLAFQEQWRH
jgi:hypothetical protein